MRSAFVLTVLACAMALQAAPAKVGFRQSTEQVECYGFVAVVATVDRPDAGNPLVYDNDGWFDTPDKPDRDDGFADGAPIFWFFNHKTWLAVQPQKVTRVFHVQDTDSESFDLLDARRLDYRRMTDDFFRVLQDPAVYRNEKGNPGVRVKP